MDVPALEAGFRQAQRRLDQEMAQARMVAEQGQATVSEIATLRRQIDLLEQAQGVLVGIGEERQEQAQLRIEALVSHALATIFGESISFHLVSATKGKQAVTEFVVRSKLADGTVVDTPVMDARGGGLASVVGFLLRLVLILLSPERQQPVLLLDETFAHLSAEYEPRLAEFLRELVDKTPVQIIMVTHSDLYSEVADRVYRFNLKAGETQVTAQ